jgi:methylenetetrahydrofolate reductase (NADPH)
MADFGITQFFFEASEYEGLMEDLEDRGVRTPVLPGILPVTSLSTLGRTGVMGAPAPEWMKERLQSAHETGGAEAVRTEGVRLATELCADLLKLGVPGLHFYTFNTSSATREIYAALGLGPALSATG